MPTAYRGRPVFSHSLAVQQAYGGFWLTNYFVDAGDPFPNFGNLPGWSLVIEGVDIQYQRVHEALLTLADGHVGITGAPVSSVSDRHPLVLAAGLYDGTAPSRTSSPAREFSSWREAALIATPHNRSNGFSTCDRPSCTSGPTSRWAQCKVCGSCR